MGYFWKQHKSWNTARKKVAVNTTFTCELNDAVKKFWEFDSKLINNVMKMVYPKKIRSSLSKLQKDTKLVNGHYEVPMLGLDKDAKLPNNFYMALRRFKLLKERLQRDSTLQKKYEEIMKGYINNGYARKLSKVEASRVSNRIWYHPVMVQV